ncbi:MAG: FAD-dependent oxidoreductase [Pirellulales bacterium]
MKDRAEIVIVGAGIAGASIALHLARRGRTDVLVLEQGELISGTTSHAPGLIGQLRTSPALTRLLMDSVELYRGLELDGVSGFQEVGSLRLASSRARLDELRQQQASAARSGLTAHLLGPDQALRKFPAMNSESLEGALYIPSDGSATAPVLAGAMIRDAQALGVAFQPQTRVTAIDLRGQGVSAVQTTSGRVETKTLVIAAGIWSPLVAQLAGIAVPLVPMQHQYVETEPIEELVGRTLPNVRDPDNLVYARLKNDGLSLGGYERNPRALAGAIPAGPDPTQLVYDERHFDVLWQSAVRRFPALAKTRLARRVNGLESFTPDGAFLLGPCSTVRGLWVACGFCAHGVSAGGGVGKAMAEWIVEGRPALDLSGMDIGRFGKAPPAGDELVAAVRQVYSTYYDVTPQSAAQH